MRIFWQESATFMKILPKAVKSELRLVRFLKKKLNVAKKSLHVVTFTSKSMISSKVKACETDAKPAGNMEISFYQASNLPHMQTFGKVLGNFHVSCNEINIWQGSWKFPCTLPCVLSQGKWRFPCTVR